MKNFSFMVFFFFLLSIEIFAQPWQLQSTTMPVNATAAPFSPVDDNICWASWSTGWPGASATEYINGYLRTTDGGASWSCDTIHEAENGMIWWIDALDANTAYIAVETWVAAGMQGIYKTTDAGATWQKHPTLFASSDYGPAYVHFFDSNNGVAVGEQDPTTSRLEIYTTTNAGTDWNAVPQANIPPNDSIEFLEPVQIVENGDFILLPTIGRAGPRLYKTTDKGYNWSIITIPNTNNDYMMFAAFKNETTGMRVVWQWSQATSVLEKTTDGGANWNPVPGPYAGCIPVNVSYVPGTSSTYVITGNVNVNGYAGGSAYTLDGGATWTAIDNGNYCYTIFESANVGWATDWMTNNFYKYAGFPLPVELVSFSASLEGNEIHLKWSTATETNNRGFEIQRKASKGEFATVAFIKGNGTTTEKNDYSFADKNLDAGKYFYRVKQIDYDGQYKYSSTVEVDVRSLERFTLEQNYPNPFNPTTTIGYVLEKKSNARLTLSNAIGEEIAVLVNEEQDKGYHKVEFNAANLPSGVYIYKIEAGNYTAVKKMLFMK